MPSKPARDNNLVWYSVAIVSVLLIAGFACAWWYMQHLAQLRSQTAYTKPTQVVVGNDRYSMAAAYAIRTTAADAAWAQDAKRALEQIVKDGLMAADPARLRSPSGLKALQEALREQGNTKLHTDKVQEILFTDFLFSLNDGS